MQILIFHIANDLFINILVKATLKMFRIISLLPNIKLSSFGHLSNIEPSYLP